MARPQRPIWLVAFLLSLTALATATLVAIGCSSGGGGGASPITVSGSVRNFLGQGISGLTVAIGTKTAVSTGTGGSFSISGVTPPYDAQVISAAPVSITLYQGLSRPDPVLTVNAPGPTHSQAISGTLSGGQFPDMNPGDQAGVGLLVPSLDGGGVQASLANGAYSGTLTWTGPSTVSGFLLASEFVSAPVAKGFEAIVPITVTDGGSPLTQNIAMSPSVRPQTIAGHVNGVPAVATNTVNASFVISTSASGSLFATGYPVDASGNFVVGTDPALGATWTLQAISTSPTVGTMIDQVTGVQTSAAGIALTLHPVPGLSAPAGGATGVNTQSQFSWSASDFPAAYVVSFTSSAGRPTFTVVTAALNASIPVNQTQGVSLPSGAIYTWTVSAVGPFSTIDAAATSFGPNMAYHQSTAPTRTFTTQ